MPGVPASPDDVRATALALPALVAPLSTVAAAADTSPTGATGQPTLPPTDPNLSLWKRLAARMLFPDSQG